MESRITHRQGSRAMQWITLTLCTALMAASTLEHLLRNRQANAENFTPDWFPYIAAAIAASGVLRLNGHSKLLWVQQAFRWIGIFMLILVANGLPLDLLRLTPLMPPGLEWTVPVTKILALAIALCLGHFTLAYKVTSATTRPHTWYGYGAFLLALPYPILRTCWALGGTLGLQQPGAAGHGFVPWLACVPWLLAAVLSLLLVSNRRWMPCRLLLIIGWFATAVVAMIGPVACWSLITMIIDGVDLSLEGIATWVPCLFYGSWLLWAIAAGAATRSFQLRSAS